MYPRGLSYSAHGKNVPAHLICREIVQPQQEHKVATEVAEHNTNVEVQINLWAIS